MLDEYFGTPSASNSPPPSQKDLLRLAKKLAIGAVVYDNNLDPGVLGQTDISSDGVAVIRLSPQQTESEAKFTLMHEIGHVMEELCIMKDGEDCDSTALAVLSPSLAGVDGPVVRKAEHRHTGSEGFQYVKSEGPVIGYA